MHLDKLLFEVMDKRLTLIQREHFASFPLCHFAALLLFSPPVKRCDVGGTVYSCIIKAEPLRVINTLQRSCNMLSLSLSLFLQQSLAPTLNKLQPQYEVHGPLHTFVHVYQQLLHVQNMHVSS